MGGTGQGQNGLIAVVQSDGDGLLSGIPWWVYLIVILIGVGLSLLCFLKYSGARRRAQQPPLPGMPPPLAGAPPPGGGGNGFLIGGIAAALVLVVAPLIVMLIMQPWNNSNWLVGRWGQNAACIGRTVEFTSDGFVVSRGNRKPYQLEGDRITVEGRTEMIQHNGDQFTIEGQTFTRCSGLETAARTSPSAFGAQPAPPTPAPYAPAPTPYAPPSTPTATATPVPDYAGWVLGRWSSSDCRRSMEFRADGTATTSNGGPATFTVTPNGAGVGIVIISGGQRVAAFMDQSGPSDAILRAYQPTAQTLNLHRC